MKFFFFHLMPWPYLPDDFDQTYDSAWVWLPNSLYDPVKGHEFSAVIGATYNLINPSTHYQNGIDGHLDWGASYFLTKQFHFGAVGYYFQQLTSDSGSGANLGSFKSRIAAAGPQAGYIFPIGDTLQGYINIKAYKEFYNKNRPEGWNFWFTLAISPAPPPAPEPRQTSLLK